MHLNIVSTKVLKNRMVLVTSASCWTWCCEAGRWSVAALTAERGPAGSFITYEKRYSELISVKGEDVAGVLPLTCERPPRHRRPCGTCQRGRAAPPTSRRRLLSVSGHLFKAGWGDVSLITARCQVPSVLSNAAFSGRKKQKLCWHVCAARLVQMARGKKRQIRLELRLYLKHVAAHENMLFLRWERVSNFYSTRFLLTLLVTLQI